MEETIERIIQVLDVEEDKARLIFEEIERQKIITAHKIFNKFDEYACIKDDKWYKDYKEEFIEKINE